MTTEEALAIMLRHNKGEKIDPESVEKAGMILDIDDKEAEASEREIIRSPRLRS